MEFSPEAFLGGVLEGDWDVSSKAFASLDICVAVREVFGDGLPWQDTHFYRNLVADAERGLRNWGIAGAHDADVRCAEITRLYESIRSKGYLPTREIERDSDGTHPPLDEVAVAIGRNGELLFANSAHRLAIAKFLGVRDIPVVVAVRHRGWMAFRREIEASVKGNGGVAYQSPQHPDLSRVPAHHDCEQRFELIVKSMSAIEGELLDIGANWGFFCHKFEELGFRCTAVEDWPATLHFLTKLRDARRRSFAIVPKSILEEDSLDGREYAVVLALNIFHHFLKTEDSFGRFANFLSRLQTNEMFLEPHLPGESQMVGASSYMSPEDLVAFVSERCRLPVVEMLGTDHDGRALYHLSRHDSSGH